MVIGSIGSLDPKLLNEFYFLVITRKRNSHCALHPLHNYNPSTKLEQCLASNAIMGHKLSKYFKLVELSIVMVLGHVEDERTKSPQSIS
jgi:hypothetical protein